MITTITQSFTLQIPQKSYCFKVIKRKTQESVLSFVLLIKVLGNPQM